MKKSKMISCALASLWATTSLQVFTTSKAWAKVNCKGTATKWINDCSAKGSRNTQENFSPNAWLKMTKEDCLTVQKALQNPAIKKYVEKVQKETAKEVLKGRKI